MNFFVRLFKKTPSDDTLWNMLRENTEHLAIDNQFDQLIRTACSNIQPQRIEASRRHTTFTNALAPYTPTVNVNVMVWPPTQVYKEPTEQGLMMMNTCVHKVNYNPEKMTVTPHPKGCMYWDGLNPLSMQQRVQIKTSDNVFDEKNMFKYFLTTNLHRNKTKYLVLSGFYSNLCVARTGFGAVKEGFKPIVDPDQCYNWLTPGTADIYDIRKNHSYKKLVTEPGQIAHVIDVYGDNKNTISPMTVAQTAVPLTLKHTG